MMRGKGDQPAATTASSTIAAATTAGRRDADDRPGRPPTRPRPPRSRPRRRSTALDPSLVDQEVRGASPPSARDSKRRRARSSSSSPRRRRPTAPARPAPTPVAADAAAGARRRAGNASRARSRCTQPQPHRGRSAGARAAAAARRRAPAKAISFRPAREGLTPPRLTRRGTVPYPPMARAQRVQGTVITSVLVSETGQVLDVRVLRGVNRAGRPQRGGRADDAPLHVRAGDERRRARAGRG